MFSNYFWLLRNGEKRETNQIQYHNIIVYGTSGMTNIPNISNINDIKKSNKQLILGHLYLDIIIQSNFHYLHLLTHFNDNIMIISFLFKCSNFIVEFIIRSYIQCSPVDKSDDF